MIDSLVSPQWLYERINQPTIIVLDASPESNKSGLIPSHPTKQILGARKFDSKHTFSDKNSSLPNMLPSPEAFEKGCRELGINNESIIVVYDNLGVYSSPRVWWMFNTMGHSNITVLNGGLAAWVDAGFPVEEIKLQSYEKGNFTASFQPDWVVNKEFIHQNIYRNEALILDARSTGRFNGTQPDPRPELPSGNIPNSVNLPFKEVLQDGRYKSTEELSSIFSKFKLQNRRLVFSCGSGITACVIMLAAQQVVDNPKAVYDGSWTEWAG